jgi:aryl-alcohol dehydrogenase-like predicted oxidoreductase
MSVEAVTRAPLGRSGVEIERVGLGAWALGGPGWEWGWGPQADGESVSTIHRAVERGLRWVDTAASYGLGHGERVVGRALRGLPGGERPLVFTKGGTTWRHGARSARRVGDPASLRRQCDASLRRLGVERIDLYQLHWPPEDGTPIEAAWAAMAELVDAGKVRWIGVCNFNVDLLARCEAVRAIDSVQAPLSLIARESASDVVPWCFQNGAAMLAYSPLQSGLLSGGFGSPGPSRLHAADWRRRDQEFAAPRVARNLELVECLRAIARRHGRTVAEVAIAWVLAWPICAAIAGARRPDQVDAWCRAADLSLTAAELREIANAIATSGAGAGPAQPSG